MSIVLKDGTVLPDLPEGVITEEYPYAYIAQSGQIGMGETDIVFFPHEGRYIIRASKYKAGYISPEVAGMPFGVVANISTTEENTGHAFIYDMADADSGWVSVEANSILPYGIEGYIGWSNHDVCVVSGFDEATGEMIYGEIYFPSSVSKPPFVLPDGTELPALPDGWSDGTPYGAVVISFGMTLILASTTPFSFVSKEILSSYGIDMDAIGTLGAGKQYYYSTSENEWVYDGELEFPALILLGTEYIEVKWFNHDVNIALSFDLDARTVELGELYRQSDENYRITGGYMTSIANEARRLGGKTGGMLPAVTEAILRAVPPGGGAPYAEGVLF